MAEDHDNAISRVDDLIATLHLNSICYVVQAREHRATTAAIYASSPWKLAREEGLVQYDRSSVHEPYLTSHESCTLDYLTGRLPKGYIATIEIDCHRCQISVWKFEYPDIMTRQPLCEAL